MALRGTPLLIGLALVALVMAVGVFGRVALDRLRLLMVPRLSILLCLVVLCATGFALFGEAAETRDFYGAVLFPIVILTMLIERFSVSMAEEGPREALVQAGYSLLVAMAIYPVFRSPLAEHLMFSFPELVVLVSGLLVWIGGYTGYRVADLLRFRELSKNLATEVVD